MQGTIKKINSERGFGFIRTDTGEDVFFHNSSVADGGFDRLREGQQVTFETEPSPRGPRAREVKAS